MKKKILINLLLGITVLSMVITPAVAAQKAVVHEQVISPADSVQEQTNRFAPGVKDLLVQGTGPVQVIIQTASHEYSQISSLISQLGGTVSHEYQTINAIAATIPANSLFDLSLSPDTVKIYQDSLRYLQESHDSIDRGLPEDIVMPHDEKITVNPISVESINAIPSTYANPALTKADQVWLDPDVNYGAGAKVAIIDTGCWHTEWEDPNGGIQRPWYWGNVYGGVDISYDVGNPTYEGYDNPMNHYHGTVCAALLAAHAEVTFSPNHLWGDSILYHYPEAGYYEENVYTLEQAGTTYYIDLIEGAESASAFYDYFSASGHTPYMEDRKSKVYLYNDTVSGEISLIMHHSMDNTPGGALYVDFDLEGVPEGAYVAVSDDPTHNWNKTRPGTDEFNLTLEPEGNWYHSANSDGGVIGGLPTDEHWAITINPNFIQGLTDWQYQLGASDTIELKMSEPITISRTSRAHVFVFGIAPGAEIFAVKVFDHTGGGVPSSKIMEGIEEAMMEGVDVISMSLGGGVGAPGADPEDLLVDAATKMGITVVAAASNDGPAPLRVASPGTAKSSITVGAAIDPIHHRIAGGIIYGHPVYGYYYYPSDEKSIAYFSSRGPTSDGRMKPDVVATGYWTFAGYPPSRWPYTITIGGGTSYSCPQVAGEAALLTAYIKNTGKNLGPKSIKEAIRRGAEPIDGFVDFEQGCGYINCENSLKILKTMTQDPYTYECKCKCRWYERRYCWKPPIETIKLKNGKVTIKDLTINPGQFEYFAFWVSTQVDSIRITMSGVEFDPNRNPAFGTSGYIYLSSAARDGIDDYPLISYFDDWYGETEFIYQFSSDFAFQPGVVRLVFEGDWWNYNPIHVEELTIEVVEVIGFKFRRYFGILNDGVDVEEAQVSVYDGKIKKHRGRVKEGESDVFKFSIPDEFGTAIVELSWRRDWAHWATSDLDILIFDGEGYLINIDGATGSSPETAVIYGAGDYYIMVDGYQVYWNRNEKYTLRIIYIADGVSLWDSEIIVLDCWIEVIRLPKCLHGIAIIWIHDTLFDYWYIADYVKV
jgi:hypothetical protein